MPWWTPQNHADRRPLLAAARVAYKNVTMIREYPSWPYRQLVEDRLTTDLDVRAALYQDEDPSNDPPFAGNEINRRCTICHAATAAE